MRHGDRRGTGCPATWSRSSPRCAGTGSPVGPGETIDAGHVLGALDLLQREHLREGLAAALLRRSGQRQASTCCSTSTSRPRSAPGPARSTCRG